MASAERPTSASHPERVLSPDATPLGVWRGGAGEPLLLVHGTTADHSRWARVAAGLEANFTVYALDRRGRGSSGDAAAYAIEREGEDIAAVVDWIGAPVTLLGHSYGAICCIEAALRTRKLRRLILYEPPLPTGIEIVRPATRARIDGLLERGEREAALLVFFREVVGVPDAQLELMRAQPAWAARVAAAHTVARELRVEQSYRLDPRRLQGIDTPCLLLLGGESPRFFREATRQLAAALPNARIVELPGQQHLAMDVAPDEFVAIVSAFARS